MTAEIEITFHPDIDWKLAKDRFAETGRLQIRNIFPDPLADRIYQALERETPWFTVYNQNGEDRVLTPDQLRNMTESRRRRMIRGIHERAAREFQYLYNSYPYLGGDGAQYDPQLFLHRMTEFLNTPQTLRKLGDTVGIEGLTSAELQATLYRPDHFLTLHTDEGPGGAARRVAFVFNFTRAWRPDWGGYVQFYDSDDNIIEAFMPRYNSLNLFAVPTRHSVSYVTPFATGRRYAITGWFRDD